MHYFFCIMEHNRLEILIKALDVSKTDFAHSIGKTIENIRKYEVGTRTITKKFALAITAVYKNVNYEWIRNGTGEMFISESAQSLAISNNIIQEPSAEYLLKKEIEYKDKLLALKEERIKQLEQELQTEKRREGNNTMEAGNNAHSVLLNSHHSKKKRNSGK